MSGRRYPPVIPARGTPRCLCRGDLVAEIHISEAVVMGPAFAGTTVLRTDRSDLHQVCTWWTGSVN
jgi:hypothetical protein